MRQTEIRDLDAKKLRKAIVQILRKQGFTVGKTSLGLPANAGKEDYRQLNALAVAKKRSVAKQYLQRHEDQLIEYIADGQEVHPAGICPEVVLVERDTIHELLFRYVALHWSIPVSSGYGRRLRFLVFDRSNGKLIGLFGLGDPVFSLGARDQWIGWDNATKKQNLYHVLDAYILGAVPPYSDLLCGKLVVRANCFWDEPFGVCSCMMSSWDRER